MTLYSNSLFKSDFTLTAINHQKNFKMSSSDSEQEYQVAVYNSTESDSTGDEQQQPIEVNKRRKLTWLYKQTFETTEAAQEWLEADDNWGFHYENETEIGQKKHYRCKQVPFRGPQCAAAIYLLFNSYSLNVTLFATPDEHTHEQINGDKRQRGINKATKLEIDRFIELKVSGAKNILANLVEAQKNNTAIKIPTIVQINNYIMQKNKGTI